jgi:hypothetical protein
MVPPDAVPVVTAEGLTNEIVVGPVGRLPRTGRVDRARDGVDHPLRAGTSWLRSRRSSSSPPLEFASFVAAGTVGAVVGSLVADDRFGVDGDRALYSFGGWAIYNAALVWFVYAGTGSSPHRPRARSAVAGRGIEPRAGGRPRRRRGRPSPPHGTDDGAGTMNIVWMATITVVLSVERTVSWGGRLARVVGLAAGVAGVVVLVGPTVGIA